MTTARFHTTVTEVGSFRTCRRRWFLDTHLRLAPKTQVTWYLIFGDCIHAALEVYYKSGRDAKKMRAAFVRAWKKEDTALRVKYGPFYLMGIEDEWQKHKERGFEMLRCYDLFDREDPFFDHIDEVGIEERSFIEILGPDGEPLPGSPLLSGKIDLIGENRRDAWGMDHKALAGAPSDAALDIDDQLTGYTYIYWRISDTLLRGFAYNVLIKDPPKPPRILQSGELSKDKSQRTTYDLYLNEINRLKLDVADYEEVLTFLKASGWRRYFIRIGSGRSMEHLASYEDHLWRTVRDMQACIEDPAEAYPNPSQYVCPGCAVMPICSAMEMDEDVEQVIANGFITQEPRTKIPKGV